MHLPDWLYEAKPALYGAAGIAFASCVHNALGRGSGILLLLAAGVILAVRKRHRGREAAAMLARCAGFEAPPSRLAATTAFVRAVAPPQLGHADIDRQHRSLAAQCATLHVAFEHSDAPADLELFLGDLVDAFEQHLAAEEAALGGLDVAHAPAAVAADLAALAAAQRTLAAGRRGEIDLEEAIRRITQDAVAAHLKRTHPALPSMEQALQRLRDDAAT